MIRVLWSRVLAVVRSRRDEVTLSEEIQAHLDHLADQHRKRGLTPAEARTAARRDFGGVQQIKEAYRDQRGLPLFDAFAQDARYALRTLRRSPGFTAVVVMTLALGIGANTTMFSLADALVLKPLPVDRPEQLRALFQVVRAGGRALKSGTSLPFTLFLSLRTDRDAFSDMLAFVELDELRIDSHVRGEMHANALFVSDNYFRMLGVAPPLGRGFAAGEDGSFTSNAANVVILSDRFWRRDFAADRAVLGKELRIGSATFTVIGVTPPEFFGVVLGRAPDIYLPMGTFGVTQPGLITAEDPRYWLVHAVGRLAGNVSDQAAAGRLTTILQASWDQAATPKPVIELLPIDSGFSDVRTRFLRPVQVLMVMVGILLFVACANVAVMLLSRNVARRTEIAIRMAIGAGGRRVLQQLMTEGLVVALLAAAVGLLLTPWAMQALVGLLPPAATPLSGGSLTGGTGPMALQVAIDTRVLLFTAGISIAAALIFAAVPALRALTPDPGSLVNRERVATRASRPPGGWLVAAQIAMSLVILTGAGLFARTLHGLATLDPGYKAEGLVQVEVNPGARGYSGAQLDAYYRDVLVRLESIPGAQSATASLFSVLANGMTTGTVNVPGFAPASDDERWVQVFLVGPRFFETLGISVVSGRDFTAADMSGPRVAALNESAARRFFGSADPIGSIINDGVRILAVAGDARYNGLRDESGPAMFVPYSQSRGRGQMLFSVRTSAGGLSAAVMRAAREPDRLVPMRVTRLRDVIERSLSQERLLAVISGFFAVTALSLLAIGLFGLVTFRTRQRTTEIGVRLALGARTDQVIWLGLRQPIKLALIGIAIGIPTTLGGTRLMTSLLFGLTPGDVPTIAGAALGVLLIVVAAASWPAWRASRLDPVTALRHE